MTRFILRHRAAVLLAWLIFAAAGVRVAPSMPARLDYTYTTPGQPGYEANLAILDRFGLDAAFEPTLAILQLAPGRGMTTPAGRRDAADAFAAVSRTRPMALADFDNTRDGKFILDGGAATWALIGLPNPDKGPGVGQEETLPKALRDAAPAGSTMIPTGFAQMLSNAGPNSANLLTALGVGGLLAFAVLFLVYGSAIAILPILMAVPAICVTVLCVRALTAVAPVSYFVQYMITLLSLGLTIDFSLIFVVRWREETERGLAPAEAVIESGRTAGSAIALSGLTASTGLLSLIVLPVPFLRSIGYGGMVIPFVAVGAALTLLPVALAAAGPALDQLRLVRAPATYSPGWARLARGIVARRWVAAGAGLLVLALLAVPALFINTAEPLISSLSPAGPAAEAFRRLQHNGVPAGVDFPIQIITHGGSAGRAQARAAALAAPGIYDVISPDTAAFRNGEASLLVVIPRAEGGSAQGVAIVSDLRRRMAAIPGGAKVGGSTAADMSFTSAVYGNFPRLLLGVGLITLAILTVALRSPVLAAKAVILNTISLGAAYGFMVVFWQRGFGAGLFYGVAPTGAIRDWIPVVVFALLFGLSMDYEVFVLARIREEYDRTGSTEQAIVDGLARTGRLVTCAALVLMVTFFSLSIDPNQLVKIIATTLGFGVIVDAVLIRTLLVPALVSLMGRWNWWYPTIKGD